MSVAKGGQDVVKLVGAVVVFRIDTNESIDTFVRCLPRRMEDKENTDLMTKFRGGAVFSKDRVNSPCGQIS